MKGILRNFSSVWLLFAGFALALTLVVSGIGSLVIFHDYKRFQTEAGHFRKDYVAGQRRLIKEQVEQAVDFIQYSRARTEKQLKESIRSRTLEACAIAAGLYRQSRGRATPEEMRKIVRETLRPARFNHGRGYYFATGMDGVEILFADRPELEGQSMLGTRDTRGAYVIRDMIALVREKGEGYYEYTWTKPGTHGADFRKIAYVKYFAPIAGFIGTGEHLDDVERDIRKEVLDRLGKIRFGKDGYIFVVNTSGHTLMNGLEPQFIGKNVRGLTDINGVGVFEQEREGAEKPGGGFIQYEWKKPGTLEVRPKLSFVKGFARWGWIVGAGVYSDDVEPVITRIKASVQEAMWKELSGLGLTLTALLAVGLVVFFYASRFLKLQLDVFVDFFKEAETGGRPIAMEHVFSPELRRLGQSANTMLCERREAETALRENELRLRTILQTSNEGFWLLDNDSLIIDVNPRMCDILGRNKDEVLGRRIFDFVKDKDRDIFEPQAGLMVKGGAGCYEAALCRPAGSLVYCRFSASPLLDGAGKRIGSFAMVTDITERRLAEEELRLGENRLRRAEITAHFGNWEFALGSNKVVASEGARIIYGLGDREWSIPEVQALPLPEYRGMLDLALRKLVGKGEPYDVEFKIRRAADGKIVDIHSIAEYSREQAVVFGVIHDITDRKMAEEAVRTHEERLRTAMEATQQVWFDMNVQTGEVSVGPEYVRLVGYKPEENRMNFQSWINAIHPEDRSGVLEVYEECIRTANTVVMEYRLKFKTGEWIWVRTMGKIVSFDSENKPLKITGTHRDVSTMKQAEAAQRESEQLYRSVVSLSPDAIVIFDKNGLLTFASPMAREIFRHSPDEEIIGRSLFTWVLPEEKERASENVLHLLTEGTLINREYTLVRANGTCFRGEINGALIHDPDTKSVKILLIIRDITERMRSEHERRELQAQLNQAQKMESIGRLAGGVAHDFNNMLGVILGNSELGLAEIDSAHPVHNNLMEIRLAADRSANLVGQLLAFARKQTIVPRVLDLNEAVGSMLKMVRRLIGENIRLSWRPGGTVWPVRMDPGQVDQILANLCVNSRDAIAGVGSISIETYNASIDENYCRQHADASPGHYVVLSVEDDGAGMEKKTLDKLFEPFFTTKEVGKGTGLGLSTVYGIVRQNGGFIEVGSVPGEGAAFRIHLPRTDAAEKREQPGEQSTGHLKGTETILLVEDEKSILELGKRILERCGYKVLAAGEPEEAINLANSHSGRIDLLITDIIMPTMNGKDLAEKLSEFVPASRTIFMSGYTGDAITESGFVDEGINFLQKPFSLKTLTEKVREVLSR